MASADWHVAEDVDYFLARAGDFLYSRPALHTVPLTATETLRAHGADAYGAEAPVFGWLEEAGEVCAIFLRTPPRRLNLTPLTPEQAGSLAALLASLGRTLPGVSADRDRLRPQALPVLGDTGWHSRLHGRPDLDGRRPDPGGPGIPRPTPPATGLYQRVGYLPVTDFAIYHFS
jgi:hypothetical protein